MEQMTHYPTSDKNTLDLILAYAGTISGYSLSGSYLYLPKWPEILEWPWNYVTGIDLKNWQ